MLYSLRTPPCLRLSYRTRTDKHIHPHTPTHTQGVRALALRANNTELVSGGSDGVLIVWDVSSKSLGRVLKTIQVGGAGGGCSR